MAKPTGDQIIAITILVIGVISTIVLVASGKSSALVIMSAASFLASMSIPFFARRKE